MIFVLIQLLVMGTAELGGQQFKGEHFIRQTIQHNRSHSDHLMPCAQIDSLNVSIGIVITDNCDGRRLVGKGLMERICH